MADKFEYLKEPYHLHLQDRKIITSVYIAFKVTAINFSVNSQAGKVTESSGDVNCNFYYLPSTSRIYLHFSLSET